MPIKFVCTCQKRLQAPDSMAGKRVKCPACSSIVAIPEPEIEEPSFDDIEPIVDSASPDTYQPEPEPPPKPASRKPASADRYKEVLTQKPVHSWRDFTYFLLLFALVPLVFSLFEEKRDDVSERIEKTIAGAPKAVQQKVEQVMERVFEGKASEADLFAALPEGRLLGAHLPRSTMVHYLYGLAVIAGFLVLGVFLVRAEDAMPVQLFLVGLFTGTVGIAFLLLAQFLASATQGGYLISRNIFIMVPFWIAWAIGFSYRAALDADIGFVGSFLGFTFGVGLCEEVCKALPLLAYYKNRMGTWHQACAWGFASGVGFGVAEAIMYSGSYYNGVHSGNIYVVRFISCVALHVIWSLSVALFIHSHPGLLQGAEGWLDYIPRVIALVAVPMVLTGSMTRHSSRT